MNWKGSELYDDWQRKVKLLCASAWRDANLNQTKVDLWLENFTGRVRPSTEEYLHAFHLLQQFIYFGREEITQCLEVLFRDHYVYPFVQLQKSAGVPWENIRANLEVAIVNETRFVAVGGAAESGHSFLYDFRKANDLPMEAFAIDQDVIEVVSSQKIAVTPPSLRHLIYVDDFCATGQQVNDRAGRLIRLLKTYRPDIKISYYLLFATESAIANLKGSGLFDNVAAAVVFDPDYRVFGESSHFYKTPIPGVNLQVGREIMQGYGSLLFSDPLGFKNSQLLVGFNHNTPDNTLPVFWASESWQPIFHRAHKH